MIFPKLPVFVFFLLIIQLILLLPHSPFAIERQVIDILESMEIDIFNLILMLPVLGAVIVFFRQIIGLKTFGIFGPAILGLSLHLIGVFEGLVSYAFLIFLGLLIHTFLKRFNISRVSISSNLIFLLSIGILIIGFTVKELDILFSIIQLPLIITIHIIERFDWYSENEGMDSAFIILFQTVFIAMIASFLAEFFITSLDHYQMIHIFLISFYLNILMSFYKGVRLVELFRFKKLIAK